MKIEKHAAIPCCPPQAAPRNPLPPGLVLRLGTAGEPPDLLLSHWRNMRSLTEVLLDAASVSVSIQHCVLCIAPAQGFTSLDISIEECSDGSILISDDRGYAGNGAAPELRGTFTAIHITLGVDGDDNLLFDFPSTSRHRGEIRIFSAFGDDITNSCSGLFARSRSGTKAFAL
jgi:hypothetical protein